MEKVEDKRRELSDSWRKTSRLCTSALTAFRYFSERNSVFFYDFATRESCGCCLHFEHDLRLPHNTLKKKKKKCIQTPTRKTIWETWCGGFRKLQVPLREGENSLNIYCNREHHAIDSLGKYFCFFFNIVCLYWRVKWEAVVVKFVLQVSPPGIWFSSLVLFILVR